MHELSIALDLIDAVSAKMATLGPVQVTAVRLRLGALSGVVRDALLFSYETAIVGTPLESARLQIEEIPATVWCDGCEAERDLAHLSRRRCPACDAPTPRVVRGTELELVGLEIQDA